MCDLLVAPAVARRGSHATSRTISASPPDTPLPAMSSDRSQCGGLTASKRFAQTVGLAAGGAQGICHKRCALFEGPSYRAFALTQCQSQLLKEHLLQTKNARGPAPRGTALPTVLCLRLLSALSG